MQSNSAMQNKEIAMKAIQQLWVWLTHYKVCVVWYETGSTVLELRKVHYAKTLSEAYNWMACYPVNAVVMVGKRNTLMFARGHYIS